MVSQSRYFGGVALVVLVVFAVGCAETHQTTRSIDQHPGGEYSTVETAEQRVVGIPGVFERREYRGTVLWGCDQTGDTIRCNRVCDAGWDDDRLCEPYLHHEFGQINEPDAGVKATALRREIQWMEAELIEEQEAEQQEADDQDADEHQDEPEDGEGRR